MAKKNRPPMYCLIWTIIVATGLILIALLASGAFLVMLVRADAQTFAIIPFLVAATFFYIGLRSMLDAVRFLRRTMPDGNRDPWIFWIGRYRG